MVYSVNSRPKKFRTDLLSIRALIRSMTGPGIVSLRVANNLQADNGTAPLPGHADCISGAMALLLAVSDFETGNV